MSRLPTIQIDDAELGRMTSDLAQMHNDTFARFTTLLAEINDQTRGTIEGVRRAASLRASRRNFLAGGLVTAGALGGGVLLSACGSSSSSESATPASSSADLDVARLAASLEILAVNTYATALKAAASGALGPVPAAVGTFALTAQKQHQDHRDAWNSALTAAGKPAQTAPDPKLDATVKTQLAAVKTITDLAGLALSLETVAAETYTAGAAVLQDDKNRQAALSIAPVEAQHVAILRFVLGQYPVPDSTLKVDMARSVSDLS